MTLTPGELKACEDSPEVLRVMADWNDFQASHADSIGDYEECVKYHDARAKELRAEADRIEKEY
ncbi:hypothetical protein ACO0LM_12055 [Undibacterium sp. Di26W]|uniref:hypothetical protein n=1 Tax=Undibacterium sp. Di26W TaxID=3413035 RepID=UPI003BF3851D